MDQESFRRLLETPRPSDGSTPTSSRGSLLASTSSKPKTIDASKPAFKPRKIKKQGDPKYRDRAAERRVGEGNDYAQVEAVLEDFERRAAQSEDKDAVEEQRRYLGGDKDHTILVKGLDVALLEQNKARAAISTEDDDTLEQAFLEASSEPSVPKKRTREELLQVLNEKKQKREAEGATNAKTADEEARVLEEAKKAGKFRPIGFKPIGGVSAEEKGKKKRTKEKGKDGERKKKKRKVEDITGVNLKQAVNGEGSIKKDKGEMLPPPLPNKLTSTVAPTTSTSKDPVEITPEPMDEDFDIFAGAGEYQGIDLGDDEDDEEEENKKRSESPVHGEAGTSSQPGRWFATEESETRPILPRTADENNIKPTEKSRSPHARPEAASGQPDEEGEEEEQPTRLVPLQSSALPSIRDFLAMDEAVDAQDKRKKRKDKRKGVKGDDDGEAREGKKLSAEVKADRDYKRLKSYTDKKAGASGK